MAITPRQVNNKRDGEGVPTGRPGTVYDVNVKYKLGTKWKQHSKKGFTTKREAQQYEAEMKVKLSSPTYAEVAANQSKQTVQQYLEDWVEQHGAANLRPSTFDSYKGYIRNHIVPALGHVQLRSLTPAMLDDLFRQMFEKGLSQSSVRYAQRILSVALEAARKYHYIETNPARDILTKFGKGGKTPDPYTVQQIQQLMGNVAGTDWEMPIMLAAMYGLRISEALGLRWTNVDMEEGTFAVVEQLPHKIPAGMAVITEMAPVKGKGADGSGERVLPITEAARPYFQRQLDLQARQKSLAASSGTAYYDNQLVIANPNGSPRRRDRVSADFGQLIRRLETPHIRFHDLRHSAATNMHELTGDFYTVGMILGHSLKGVGIQLGISTNMEAMTANYVDVRLERKKIVLDTYHNALHPKPMSEDGA
ncbi:tyrosine-type recombinase/integrase [Oscillospiraceae bacterium OttesenSCG-928-G22]|nr:tyrosine-type recombinase/integrase [Oscillospiraceae bacterium OttesenSCG-928-G22]